MSFFARAFAVVLVMFVGMFWAPAASAQLYGDKKDVTSGELNDQDYWWARFDDMMLDEAMKHKQPEGRIGLQLASTTRRLDELTKKYPKHEEIKKMKQHADDVLSKINPNADRGAPFSPECPWEEANFAQIWVNIRWAQAAWKEKDYQNVSGLMKNVNDNLNIMLAPDRMKNYPPELSKAVRDAKPEADKLTKMVHDKLNGSSTTEVKPESNVASGDLNNQDYWWARFDDMMLDLALKERQPEGHIDVQLAGAMRRLDELSQKFPNHDGIKKMKQHAEDVHSKIDPNAPRSTSFAPEVPWEEANFAQLWVNLHHAETAHAQKDDATASGLLSNVRQNQEILLRPGRMKEYPPELKKWVEDSKAQADELAKAVKGKKGR
ncbi:MAG: hypothetical protein ACREJD_00310 [Phycisphaerales bacterium]